MYHRISDRAAEGVRRYTVSPSVFAGQMNYLVRGGYRVVGLDDVVESYVNGAPLTKKTVVITFDDGYLDNYTNAYPVLARYGFKATIFLVAEMVGGKAEWDAELGDPLPDLMNWEHVFEMEKGGIQFGAHTCRHPHLKQLPHEEAEREIAESKRIIEQRLQCEVNHFAYPYQDYNQLLRRYVVRSGYKAACSSIWGRSSVADDRFMLRRMPVWEHHDMAYYRWLVKVDEANSPLRRLMRGKRSALRRKVARLVGSSRS